MRTLSDVILVVSCMLLSGATARGQSSSLYHHSRTASRSSGYDGKPDPARPREERSKNPLLDETSLIAMPPPEARKFQVHDLISVIVIESKKFQTDANTKSERDFEFNSELDAWIDFFSSGLGAYQFVDGRPNIDYKLETELENRGRLKRQDKLSTRIACEVIDVKPNGNLVLQATRRLYHDEEEIVVTLTGVCRSADISLDNTILSSKVAALDFNASHTGAVRDGTRRGWLTRVLDLVRPF